MNFKENFSFLLSVSGKERYKLYISALLSVLSSLLAIVPYLLMSSIIVELMKETVDFNKLKQQVVLVSIMVVIRMVAFLASGVFSHVAAFTILYELRMKAVGHLAKLNMGFFTGETIGGIKKTLNEDIEKLEDFIAHQIPDLASAVVTPLIIISYLFYLNWQLALLLFVPIVLAFGTQFAMFKGMESNMGRYHALLERLNSTIVQYVNGMNVMKAFNLSAKSFKNYKNVTEEYADLWEEMTISTGKHYGIFLVLIDSGLLFMIPAGGYMFFNSSISVATYIIFLVLCSSFLASFKHLLEFGMTFSMLLEGAGKVKGVLNQKVQNPGFLVVDFHTKGRVEFKNVSFKYNEKEVIHELSLMIDPGSIVALVGPSGSGKTTLGQLLGRFWDVDAGGIYVDGMNIRDIQMNYLMNMISFVFQDVFMLHDTIAENVRMGGDYSQEEIVEACKKAQIHTFIESLPQGYTTQLGEAGIKLSGGEKQRISIARAILKDSPIVVLDEVTSYSDIENESKIQGALKTLLKDKTAIIIAHRLYTIRNADKIVVLDQGRIAEVGSHEHLIAERGIYSKLWSQYDVVSVERGA